MEDVEQDGIYDGKFGKKMPMRALRMLKRSNMSRSLLITSQQSVRPGLGRDFPLRAESGQLAQVVQISQWGHLK